MDEFKSYLLSYHFLVFYLVGRQDKKIATLLSFHVCSLQNLQHPFMMLSVQKHLQSQLSESWLYNPCQLSPGGIPDERDLLAVSRDAQQPECCQLRSTPEQLKATRLLQQFPRRQHMSASVWEACLGDNISGAGVGAFHSWAANYCFCKVAQGQV